MFKPPYPATSQSGRSALLVLGIVVILAVAAVVVLQLYASSKAETEVDRVVQDLRAQNVLDMEYSDVNFDLLSMDVVIEDVTLNAATGGAYSADRLVVSDYDIGNDFPEYMNLRLENISVPVDEKSFGPDYEKFLAMGYETLEGDLVVDFKIDRAGQRFIINELSLKAKDLGTISISLTLGQITPENFLAYLFDPSGITVDSVEIFYQDDSFAERTLAQAAREQNSTEEDLRVQALAGVDQTIEQARQEGSERGVAFLEAFKQFLSDPGSIRITAAPAEPVSVGRLMQAEGQFTALDLLNVSTDVE